jgi:hypothetical protein
MDELANASRTDPLKGVLLAVSALLAAMILYQGAAYLDTSRNARTAAADIAMAKEPPKTDVQSNVAHDKSVADGLKKKNLFIPPAAPRNPVTEVAGILGNEALINGQWYKARARVGQGKDSALILAIEPTKIRVMWDGKEAEFRPIDASGQSSGPPTPGSPGPSMSGEGRRGGAPSAAVRPAGAAVPAAGARRGGMSSEEAAALNERMRNASSEERQRLMNEVRQRASGQQ